MGNEITNPNQSLPANVTGGSGGDAGGSGGGGGNLASEQLGALSTGLGGLGSIVSSIVGGRARRQEQRAARQSYRERMKQFENMYYYWNSAITPYEDITVNQLQAQFQARQQQQGLGTTMATLRDAAGGSGVASLAQTIANQQAQNLAKISGDIGQQEAANQELIGQGEYMRSMAVERAEQRVRDKSETLLALSQQRKAIADQARKDATEALTGGIGQVLGGVGQMLIPTG